MLLLGRGAPTGDAALAIAEHGAVAVRSDVTDRDALIAAIAPHGPVHAVVHSAGVLADGPLGQVDPERGRLARAVKVNGWLNTLAAAGRDLEVAVGLGSWAGRFGNRHQAHYAAANALLAALTASCSRNTWSMPGS